jgi:hypothetical protein
MRMMENRMQPDESLPHAPSARAGKPDGRYRLTISYHQSPLNPVRWCLTLECGHKVWITSRHRPQRKGMRCPSCVEMNRPQRSTRAATAARPSGDQNDAA